MPVSTQAKYAVPRQAKLTPCIAAKCPVKHKPLQKGSFSFHSSQNIYTCHFKTSALLIVSLCQQKQANLFLGSDHFTEMKTIMDNRHTAKRSQTHETIEVAC
jgi:hypothetical protein